MPLDPQARLYLDKLRSLNIPEFHTMPPAEARQLFRAMRGLAARPDPVEAIEDRTLPGPVPIRAYRPIASPPGPLPALVYYHGGGWVLGDIGTVDNLCRRLANASGCVVVSVGYRLAPEHKFPTPLDDCHEAARHVADEAGSLGIDRDRIGVGGDSAGGNLAAGVALMARDRGGPPIACQLLAYPIADHSSDTPSYRENAEGFGLTREMMAWYWGQYLGDARDGDSPLASPLRARDHSGLPPSMVITAGFDVLRDEGRAYADKLAAAGVAVDRRHHPGMIHGFLQMADSFDRAREAIGEAGEFLRRVLVGSAP